ncbi:MAG: RNA polymerase subunit sigma [Gemmatimonadetes bacterium]|nr:MAG: RNA polymerase subunit sigma [Gemmatimonadota bacterium]PYP06686.1 MAG: RNA polymerase subunit sigma [Gemmatimonadota bacterium]PYP12868.1 MAG: RNA polymerase subunit sigma [Gemmatimonadota bacterium]PYP78163.1 MAG: RNA polymerase subunit sigma [Gemmatimonadota bacterium]
MTYPKRLSQERERSLEQRLKAGDERALGELFDVAAPWILGLAFRILQDEDEAEEVVGDVFVQLWRHIDQHDGGRGPLVPWILSIARNRSLDVLRRRRRWWRKSAHLEQAQAAEASDPAVAAPHEAAVAGWPLHRAVHAALAALSEEQRRVVVLSYFEGLSHREIARRLDQPLGTVKTRLRMAHQKLTESLKHLKDWME